MSFPLRVSKTANILITNDIWLGTGHLPDITVAKPIFHHGTIVGFAGSVTHAPTLAAASRSADAREVFEEGLQIPIMRVVRRGKMDETFEQILRKNVRTPDQTMGDLYAQFAALHLIDRRIVALMRERNLESLEEVSQEVRQRSEKAMRQAIAEVPDGTYRDVAICDGIDRPIKLEMALTVRGDEIEIDYSGSNPQVLRSINVCLAYTQSYTAYGVKAVLSPDIPNNEGALAPLSITAPLGSILNSRPPAAGGAPRADGAFSSGNGDARSRPDRAGPSHCRRWFAIVVREPRGCQGTSRNSASNPAIPITMP